MALLRATGTYIVTGCFPDGLGTNSKGARLALASSLFLASSTGLPPSPAAPRPNARPNETNIKPAVLRRAEPSCNAHTPPLYLQYDMTHPLVVHSPSALPPRLVSAATVSAHSGAHAAENVRARQRARHSRQHALWCTDSRRNGALIRGAPSASDSFREERRLLALLERVGVTTHCGRARDPLPSRNWERTRRRFYVHGSTAAMTTQAAPNAPRRNPQAISARVEPRASSRARRAARRRKVSTDPPPKAGGPFECPCPRGCTARPSTPPRAGAVCTALRASESQRASRKITRTRPAGTTCIARPQMAQSRGARIAASMGFESGAFCLLASGRVSPVR
ncbi:hypothetical protein DFH06DRAFT_1463974 [Mycena polygramma]|nr:hypothetical protein DFH06DRAFT_1463974 [Mycena polygramma]